MNLHQLRCFAAVAEELHFGRAAHRLDMLPAALGRYIKLLEESLATQLLFRTTRSVTLTADGAVLQEEARLLLARADELANRFRDKGRERASMLRLGALDTAAAGLVPLLLQDFRKKHRDVTIHLIEDKTSRLLPRLLSGAIDLALVRPPAHADRRIEFLHLFHESAVIAVPAQHSLAGRKHLTIGAIANEPLIVPDRRWRPHSHDLTVKLFEQAGLRPNIAFVADEKQTIIHLVAAEIGLAIIPRWASRLSVPQVRYIPLQVKDANELKLLPLAAAWIRASRDPVRDKVLEMIRARLKRYRSEA